MWAYLCTRASSGGEGIREARPDRTPKAKQTMVQHPDCRYPRIVQLALRVRVVIGTQPVPSTNVQTGAGRFGFDSHVASNRLKEWARPTLGAP